MQNQGDSQLRTLERHQNREEDEATNSKVLANGSDQGLQSLRRSTRGHPPLSSADTADSILTPTSSTAPVPTESPATMTLNTTLQPELFVCDRDGSNLFSSSAQSRRGRDSAVGSPSRENTSPRRNNSEASGAPRSILSDSDLSVALEDLLDDDPLRNRVLQRRLLGLRNTLSPSGLSTDPRVQTHSEFPTHTFRDVDSSRSGHASGAGELFGRSAPTQGGPSKRAKGSFDGESQMDLIKTLKRQGAATAMLYRTAEPGPEPNDIWPHFRNKEKLPVRYSILDVSRDTPTANASNRRLQTATQHRYELRGQKGLAVPQAQDPPTSHLTTAPGAGRPFWQLPVELVEQIIEHLNRDDIKSLRLVSRELNDFTSQAAFKTVVVPFNTEIYGMLGQEPKTDRKGKKRAKISRPEYWWKNANGDDIYNGHGLDVFRGFGRHILRYGMSFEVNEDSLSTPPLKSVTEQKTSFWGNYEWPFEEYRRFDAVAGLESAADETPRMKTAFSELTKVKELALSVDSGLGWLNGPDLSIRARILQTLPSIFGSRQYVPDRRTQAQREFWSHIESMHACAGEDVRLASLFRLEGSRFMSEAQEAGLAASVQPSQPFLDVHIPHAAIPHDATDITLSQPLGDAEMLERHVLTSSSTNAGVLFTSTTLQQCDATQTSSPVVPAKLSRAQKEWLLETEWAQRAFMSSYMLSVIDNAATFASIHTLNISSLSDRYISLLNRADFWDALPCLKNVCLMVIPGWRTVEKDEAGFVETPRVDPTGHVDTFRGLLEAQVISRPKISRLEIGYTASGEHAEGLYARNKLLMPAPVLPLRVRLEADPALPPVETATMQDANMIQRFLLRFPHLEELTLRNCWITPSALLQFVKAHDGCALKRLNLKSVSLTDLLRPIGNANAQAANVAQVPVIPNAAMAQQIAGNMWAQANNNAGGNIPPAANQLPGNVQVLNNLTQMLITQLQQMQANAVGVQQHLHVHALQAQLQQQLQTVQNVQAMNAQQPQGNALQLILNVGQQNQQAQQQQFHVAQITQLNHLITQVTFLQQMMANAPAAGPTHDLTGNADSILQARPRRGSWMDIIDQISPGTNLSDFGSTHSQADPNRTTSLDLISFESCGYAKLPHLGPTVDQAAIEATHGVAAALRNPIFTKRHHALSTMMMSSKWQYLGEIVQEVDLKELAALDAGWRLRHGWDDAEAARAVEFDGLLHGGTGRFSGAVRRSDRVRNECVPA
ncbi:hypothetical protein OPT61_g7330 [Boeremia exigua]|uniref:Uncharacterized protein n=1 Tax=Boeremia exigua TaxID=749465 RepID=A0ACC2I3X5_9PLEO|nr:hypothetical protein OPT61_g7330 [Boeremia exigua]